MASAWPLLVFPSSRRRRGLASNFCNGPTAASVQHWVAHAEKQFLCSVNCLKNLIYQTSTISQPERKTETKSKLVAPGLGCIVLFVHNCSGLILRPQTGDNMSTTADDAKSIYHAELRESLERDFAGQYVAIVSPTRRHYIRATFLEAALAAREAEPDHVPFVIRIGHDAAFHIGAAST